jgi:sepiapterin reductase
MLSEGKVLVIITGASRGLGQALAIQMSKTLTNPTLLLMSRTLADLEQTGNLCKEKNEKVLVKNKVFDALTAKKEDLNDILDTIPEDFFDSVILVHNAGSLGNQGTKIVDFDDITEMNEYYRINVFSVMLLNSLVAKRFKGVKEKVVINISSLCAIEPFATWGSYCSGKAARDMVFKVMAKEEPSWTVLNYAPGPLDTKMIDDVLTEDQTDSNIRTGFEDMKAKGQLLKPKVTAKRLVSILNKSGAFKSGDHVDFYDDV